MSIDPAATLFITGVIGLLIGSFLNVVISRLPVMLEKKWDEESRFFLGLPSIEGKKAFNLFYPRSLCTACHKSILSVDNIPIASYMLLRGRCRHCDTAIPVRYPLVETLTAILAIACLMNSAVLESGLSYSSLVESTVWLCFCCLLIVLAVIDLEKQLLPDDLTLLLMWLGITAAVLKLIELPLYDSVLGALLGYSFFWTVEKSYKLARKTEGLARGDAKFLAALGAWLGWIELPFLVVFASLTGTIVAGAMIITNRMDKSQPIPFGPFLAFAGLFIVFIEEKLFAQRLSSLLF